MRLASRGVFLAIVLGACLASFLYVGKADMSVNFRAGWNSIFIGTAEDLRLTDLKTMCSEPIAFGIDEQGRFVEFRDILATGKGYFIRVESDCTVTLKGNIQDTRALVLKRGWNFTGSTISFPITRIRASCANPEVFGVGETGKFVELGPDDFLQPWKGYQIRVDSDCKAELTPEKANATILGFQPPSVDLQVGQTAKTTVWIKNTGAVRKIFFVGLSFQRPSGDWYDVQPQWKLLNPDEEAAVVFSWRVPTLAPGGWYNAKAAIWDGYDTQTKKMIEPLYDQEFKSAAFFVVPSKKIDSEAMYQVVSRHHDEVLALQLFYRSAGFGDFEKKAGELNYKFLAEISRPALDILMQVGFGGPLSSVVSVEETIKEMVDKFGNWAKDYTDLYFGETAKCALKQSRLLKDSGGWSGGKVDVIQELLERISDEADAWEETDVESIKNNLIAEARLIGYIRGYADGMLLIPVEAEAGGKKITNKAWNEVWHDFTHKFYYEEGRVFNTWNSLAGAGLIAEKDKDLLSDWYGPFFSEWNRGKRQAIEDSYWVDTSCGVTKPSSEILQQNIASLIPGDPPEASDPTLVIGDSEILEAIDMWIKKTPMPGLNQPLDREAIRVKLIPYWVDGTPVTQPISVAAAKARAALIAVSTEGNNQSLVASRKISIHEVKPGEAFQVTITMKVKKDASLIGVSDLLPSGWEAEGRGNSEFFLDLDAGDVKTISYQVTVPSDAKPGAYEIAGSVKSLFSDDRPIGGDSQIEVVSQGALSITQVIAGSDKIIDDNEILNAIRLWINGEVVPETGQTISDEEILELIAYWITDTRIDQPVPQVAKQSLDEELNSLIAKTGKNDQLNVQAFSTIPNPARHGRISFRVEGTGIESIKAEVYDLAGSRVFDSNFVTGYEVSWGLMNDQAQALANGVYLYVITVRGFAGKIVRSKVRKLVVLR